MNPTDTATPAPAASTTTIPSTWPGAFKIYQTSKAIVKTNLWSFVGVYAVLVGISILVNLLTGTAKGAAITILRLVISLALVGLEYSVFVMLYLRSSKGEKVSVNDAFKGGAPYVAKMLGVVILEALIISASFLLLIVPFFFIFPRVYLAPFFMIDKNLGILESIKASWNQTKGHVSKTYGIIGVQLLFFLLACTIIGIPFAIYFGIMYSAALVILYKFITEQSL